MNGAVTELNRLPIESWLYMTKNFCELRLWIEDGKITGYMHGDDGKLMKEEIPAKTGNQDGD